MHGCRGVCFLMGFELMCFRFYHRPMEKTVGFELHGCLGVCFLMGFELMCYRFYHRPMEKQ